MDGWRSLWPTVAVGLLRQLEASDRVEFEAAFRMVGAALDVCDPVGRQAAVAALFGDFTRRAIASGLDRTRLATWTPWAVYALVVVIRRRVWRRPDRRQGWVRPTLIAGYFAVASLWVGFGLFATEFAHEDTVYAKDFSLARWRQIASGMSEQDVVSTVGKPLTPELQPWFATKSGAKCWVRNWSAGHFACVWFARERVTRKQLWYSD